MNDDLDDETITPDEGFDEFSKKSGGGIADVIKTNPAAKVGVVLVAVAAIIGVVMMFGEEAPQTQSSALPTASDVNSTPGAQEASPAYVAAVEAQNEQNLEDALKKGESTIPVPIDTPSTRLDLPEQEEKSEDPLHRWRQLQEERVERDMRDQEAVEAVTVLDSQQQADAVQKMAEKMSAQMGSILSKNVEERAFNYVGLIKKEGTPGAGGAAGGTGAGAGSGAGSGGNNVNPEFDEEAEEKDIIISSGDIEYAQTLIEANSDVKGPVLAQLLTGPLNGSRIIGTFSVAEDDYLVLNFSTAVVNGKDVAISAIALDPDTTLAGMATDVDHRYFRRIFLPAAAAFISGFASAVAETGRTDVVVEGGTATTETEEADDEQRVATGVEEAADEVREILDEMGDVETLVIIKSGTPIGVLFTAPVFDEETDI